MTVPDHGQSGSDGDTMIGVREAAQIVGVHENTIRDWSQAGILQSVQIAGKKSRRRFSRLQVERLALTLPDPPPADHAEAFRRGYGQGWHDAIRATRAAIAKLPESPWGDDAA